MRGKDYVEYYRGRGSADVGIGVYFEKENLDTMKENSEFILTLKKKVAVYQTISDGVYGKNSNKGKA